MNSKHVSLFIMIFLVLFASVLNAQNNKTTYATLGNGMKLVLKENHSTPMITSVVFVNAGARYENEKTNGMTHFLEHLLFDGTETRNRLQVTETIEEYGGYINAFTRKDLTAYLVLMPKDYIDTGLAVQSDQLFNSVIPESELPKERKIVIEEIRKSNDVPSTLVDYYFNEVVYEGTPYARTVLGTEDHISNMAREDIVEYYEKYYIPNNMIALIIGDFDTDAMIAKFDSYFGQTEKEKMPKIELVNFLIPEGRNLNETTLPTKNYHVDLAFPAPHYTDHDYYPYYMMVEYMSSGETSPLTKDIVDKGLASSVSAYLETQKDFSLMHVSAVTDSPENARAVVWEIERILGSPEEITPGFKAFNGLIVSKKTQEIYLREKLHYYGFIIAPMMVSTGYEFVETMIDSLETVEPIEIANLSERYFSPIRYIGTLVSPEEKASEQLMTATSSDSRKVTLDNGLEVIIDQSPDSRVFAVNIFGKNRAAMEPAGKDGITDFLNRMLEKGTQEHDKEALAEELSNIGANLTVTDNPYIPYDDRYTSRQYSFIKFETIDDFASRGIDLLAEMLINPALDSAEVAAVKREMAAALGMASGSTYQNARNGFYKAMFGKNHPFSKIPLGTHRTVMVITANDLRAYHEKYYAPNNMIMTICTNLDADWVLDKIRATFGKMDYVAQEEVDIKPPATPEGVVAVNIPMDKEQAYIYLGGPTIGINDPDFAALDVATEILSSRLALELREVQGLAYSVGAGLATAKNFGWFLVSMGTGVENYQVAYDGILGEIRRIQSEPVTEAEIRKARNSIQGSYLTRRLSRINQAYYMTLYEFWGMGYQYGPEYMEKIKNVSIEDIQRAASQYLPSENYFLSTVGL